MGANCTYSSIERNVVQGMYPYSIAAGSRILIQAGVFITFRHCSISPCMVFYLGGGVFLLNYGTPGNLFWSLWREEKRLISGQMNSANTKAYSLSFLLQRSFDYPTGCNFLMGCKVNKEGCSCNSHVIYIISTGNSTLDQSSPLPCTHTVDIIQMLLGCFESKRWGGKITIFHLFLNFYGI